MVARVTMREAVDQFAVEIESRSYAASTRQTYMAKISRFLKVYEFYQLERRHQPLVSLIEPGVMATYFATYRTPLSRNDALRALRLFMKWAIRMKYISEADAMNALGERRQVKLERKPKNFIPAERFPLMLDIAGDESVQGDRPACGPQNRAIVGVTLFTLCRVSETTALTLRDVNLHDGLLRVYRKKRKRYSEIVIGPDLTEELEPWLAWYAGEMGYNSPAVMMREHPDWHLLPRIRFEKVTGVDGRFFRDAAAERHLLTDMPCRELELMMKRVLNGMGYTGEQGFTRNNIGEGMHTIRRSGARALWLGQGGDQRALIRVSRLLDHEDLKTTALYIGADIEKQELDNFMRANRMYGTTSRPRGGLGNAAVVPIHARSVGTETTADPAPYEGAGEGAQAF